MKESRVCKLYSKSTTEDKKRRLMSINRRDTDEYRSQVSGLDTPNTGLHKVNEASEPLLAKVSSNKKHLPA